MHRARRPEVLAPAGDEAAMMAAVRAGADAVYFGLQGFNARARAQNFDAAQLGRTMDLLHRHGVRGYVTLNTLVFDAELASVEAAARACAAAGVDAVIVQDLGVAALVRAVAPTLAIHASTQMTCTDAAAVELARSAGASRVILARELSLDEIAAIRRETDVELEVFVHGALCIAYSGQCLTSEAIGGRSANRGACAQACRLPYELVVDGELRATDDRAYLLSPEDLEASALVAKLCELGVASIKIEGRLKGPEYVAATTRLYRAAIAAAVGEGAAPSDELTRDALQAFSRGSGPGFLAGVDHQRLVEGRSCDHRGLATGECLGVARAQGRAWLRLRVTGGSLARGDGVLVEGGLAGVGEVGGHVWALRVDGDEVERVDASGREVRAWLGPERAIDDEARLAGRRVWKTRDPARDRDVRAWTEREGHRVAIDVAVSGTLGAPAVFEATSERGAVARVTGDAPLERATRGPGLDEALLRDKLGRLGETPFALRAIATRGLDAGAMLPPSSLNRARRALVAALLEASRVAPHAAAPVSHTTLLSRANPPVDRAPPPPGLFVLCRTLEQTHAALDAGADGVYLDFLELTGTGAALRAVRARPGRPAYVAVAPPRIRKPGEDKIDRFLASLGPDAVLVRGLGALYEGSLDAVGACARIGDFSLNVTNRLTAAAVLARGLAAFTPSFDLDAAQLLALLETPFGPWAELVVHHPMPLFHMEHCVIAALLSSGHDHRDCGRPCEKHRVSLRDRAGMDHPVEADVGCRNTVFHAAAQSAAGLVARARRAGVGRFRIELVREDADDVARIVGAYRALLDERTSAQDVWRTLRTEGGYGVVRGSLRVIDQ